MQDHVTDMAGEIAQAANVKASVIVTNSTVASGVVLANTKPEVVTKTTQVGSYLATTPVPGLEFLCYMELISIIGATYLIYQFSISIYDRFLSKFIWRNKNGQQTGQ